MAGQVRPTLRCLREDPALPVPHADTPLDEVSHPLLAKAAGRFTGGQTPQERITSIDDQVLFKVKAQRRRGAVWVGGGIAWLVAAGQHEEGSPEDFYASDRFPENLPQPFSTLSQAARLMPGCLTTPCRNGRWLLKSRSGRTSWTHPLQRNSSTSNHELASGHPYGVNRCSKRATASRNSRCALPRYPGIVTPHHKQDAHAAHASADLVNFSGLDETAADGADAVELGASLFR